MREQHYPALAEVVLDMLSQGAHPLLLILFILPGDRRHGFGKKLNIWNPDCNRADRNAGGSSSTETVFRIHSSSEFALPSAQ